MSNANPTTILGKIGKKVGEEVKTVSTLFTNHANRGDNPHNVNKTQVSLGNVENVALSSWAGSGNIVKLGTVNSGTIPYSLLSNVPDVNNITGNLTIGGNLTVGGTTTTLNTETVLVEDNVIELNMGSAGAETAQTSGIQVNRGAGSVGTSTPTYVGSVTDIQFLKAGDDVTSIRVIDNGVTSDYAVVGGASFLLEAIQGNISLDSAYIDPNNTDVELEVEGDTDGEVSRVFITDQSSGTQTTLANYDFSGSSSAEDKATIIWDDNSGQATWKFGLGTADADIKAKDVVATGAVKVPDGDGLTINNVSIGDYAVFLSALNTAKS